MPIIPRAATGSPSQATVTTAILTIVVLAGAALLVGTCVFRHYKFQARKALPRSSGSASRSMRQIPRSNRSLGPPIQKYGYIHGPRCVSNGPLQMPERVWVGGRGRGHSQFYGGY